MTTVRMYAAADEGDVRRIYEEAFPPSLRAPWAQIARHRLDETLLVLESDAGTAVGFALIRRLGPTDLAFVRYFAIDSRERSRGHGEALLAGVCEHVVASGVTALLLDVERPHGDPDDERRIAFYERNAVRLLDVPDYAPPEHGATGEQVPLLLMGRVLDGADPMSGDRLVDAVDAVLRYRYGVGD